MGNTKNAHISMFDEKGKYVASIWGHPVYVLSPSAEAWPHHVTDGLFDDSWWFYGQTRKRALCPVMVDGLTLRGVRPGSTIIIEDQQYECIEGGDVDLSFQFPGTYEVRVARWPYLEGRYTIENPSPTE